MQSNAVMQKGEWFMDQAVLNEDLRDLTNETDEDDKKRKK